MAMGEEWQSVEKTKLQRRHFTKRWFKTRRQLTLAAELLVDVHAHESATDLTVKHDYCNAHGTTN